MLTAYPTSFPTEAADIVIALIGGTAPNIPHAVRAGWTVMGFAAGMALPDAEMPPNVTVTHAFTRHPACTRDELKSYLEAMKSDAVRLSASAIPWQSILAALLALLQQVLAS